MTDSVHPAFAFDASLKVGQEVEARFTNNHRALRFRGRIKELNDKSARVESLEAGVNGWEAGHVFVIPRFSSKLWTHNNGLYPLSLAVEKNEPRERVTPWRALSDAIDAEKAQPKRSVWDRLREFSATASPEQQSDYARLRQHLSVAEALDKLGAT